MGTTADKLARLSETKALLKTRLTEKGLDVASENNFYNLADKVGEIQSGNIIDVCSVKIIGPSGFSPLYSEFIYCFFDGKTALVKSEVVKKNVNLTLSVSKGSYINFKNSDTYNAANTSGLVEKAETQNIIDYEHSFIVNGDGEISVS